MRILLIDGHYYVYRSFFAIRELSNSAGEPTNAIFGFVKTIRKMLKDLQPAYGVVLWDEGLPERRTKLQPAYKQQREEMPELMVPQLDKIRSLVPFLGLQSLGVPNTEADDLMACYAQAAESEGMRVVLATNDKDLFQLVNENVHIYSTNKSDITEPNQDFALLNSDDVQNKWGVLPHAIRDVLALTGDAADNIPGVNGIGTKTAAKLILQFGSIDTMLENTTDIANLKLREKIIAAAPQIRQNLEMVSLDFSIPLPVPVTSTVLSYHPEQLLEQIRPLEFRSLIRELESEIASRHTPVQTELF